MTLLTICQNAIDEIGSFARDDSIVGNDDEQARQLLALANRAGRSLFKYGVVNWQKLLKNGTITTVASTQAYALPSDFHGMVNATQWNGTDREPVRGPVSPQEWQTISSGWLAESSIIERFRIRNDQIEILPTPTAVYTINYQYYSNQWVQSSGGDGQVEFQADTDTALVDEDLITLAVKYQFLRAKGFPYQDEQADFNEALRSARADDGGKAILSFDRPIYMENLPETGFGS